MFLVAVPFTVLAFVLSMVMKEIPLRTTSHLSPADPAASTASTPDAGTPDAGASDAQGDGVLGAVNLVVGVPDL